jgi:hypothetical protein
MGVAKLIESGALRPFKGSVIDNTTDCSLPFVALNDPKFRLSVDTAQPVRLVVAATESMQGSVEIELAAHSSLSLVCGLRQIVTSRYRSSRRRVRSAIALSRW